MGVILDKSDAKIDLVYLWVDSSDPKWQEKKRLYENNAKDCNKDAVSDCRFIDNEELKYSLRSVEKNIPWVNKIYIVTDNQVPAWLDTNNPKIEIVNHTDIIPNDKLPLYNSCAIETRIPFIKDLSELFIYANDDMLFWQPIEPEFFFEDNKPVYIAGKRILNKKYKHLYGYTINRAYKLIKTRYGVDIPFFPHHNADPYCKSLFLECENEFKDEFEKTLTHRFRDFSDIQRTIIMYYSIAQNKAVLKQNKQSFKDFVLHKPKNSLAYDSKPQNIRKIKHANSKLLCVNDSRKTTDASRKALKKILDEKFPNKSVFEKE